MKADTKLTMEEVALMLCKGAAPPDWVVQRLRNMASLVGHHSKVDDDDTIERLLFKSALHLQDLLPMYAKIAKRLEEECPPVIDDAMMALDELIPFLAKDIHQPRSGPRPDVRRQLCAAVCADIWEELHNAHEPYSEKLWEACEAYWQACGHPETSAVARLRNWERYLLELSPP